jgi:hypothetical protein
MAARSRDVRALARTRPLLLLLVTAIVVGLVAGLARPFEDTFPVYLHGAQALLDHGQHQPSAFWPTGYMTFVFAGLALGGHQGVMLLQVLVYAGLVGLAYSALRLVRVSAALAALGALFVGFHPQFLIGINRITDLNLAAPLLIALVTIALWTRRDGLDWSRAVLLGLTAGGLFAVRPNLLAVVPAAVILVRRQLRLRQSLVALAAAVIPVMATSTVMLGHPVLISSNGPYNLAAGANPQTETVLLHDYNAEQSLSANLGHFHVSTLNQLEAPSKQGELNSFAAHYIRAHPAGFVKLVGLKLLTTFRPDLRARQSGGRTGFEKLVALVSALPVLVWLAVLIATRRQRISSPPLTTAVVALFAALYVFPLLITNADPRFRYALDGLLLLHSAALLGRWIDHRAVVPRFARGEQPA